MDQGSARIAAGDRSAAPTRSAEGVAAIASVLALYALTALVRGEPQPAAVVLVYAVAALIVARFARSPADLALRTARRPSSASAPRSCSARPTSSPTPMTSRASPGWRVGSRPSTLPMAWSPRGSGWWSRAWYRDVERGEPMRLLKGFRTGRCARWMIASQACRAAPKANLDTCQGRGHDHQEQEGRSLSNGKDVVLGTNKRDVVNLGGGDDKIYGDDGNDLVCGGPGEDLLLGADDEDELYGEGGDDFSRGIAAGRARTTRPASSAAPATTSSTAAGRGRRQRQLRRRQDVRRGR